MDVSSNQAILKPLKQLLENQAFVRILRWLLFCFSERTYSNWRHEFMIRVHRHAISALWMCVSRVCVYVCVCVLASIDLDGVCCSFICFRVAYVLFLQLYCCSYLIYSLMFQLMRILSPNTKTTFEMLIKVRHN